MLLSLGLCLQPQQLPGGHGCRPWRGAVTCPRCAADGREWCHLLVGCFYLSLKIKSGKTTKQVGKVLPSAGAICREILVCLFSGFRKHVVCHWSNYPPFLCFSSLALQNLWSHITSSCGSMEFLRWPQIAAEIVPEWKRPQCITPPTAAPWQSTRKTRLYRPCRRLH